MNKQKKTKWLYILLWEFISLIVLTALYSIMWFFFYNDNITNPFYRRGDYLIIAVYAFLLFIFTTFLQGYKIGVLRVIDLIYSHSVAIGLVNIFSYAQIALLSFELINPINLLFLSIVQLFTITFFIYFGNKVFFIIYPPKKIVVFTLKNATNDVIAKMALHHKKYAMVKHIVIDSTQAVTKLNLPELFADYDAVALAQGNSELTDIMLSACYENEKDLYFYPRPKNIMVNAAEYKNMMDSPMLLCKNSGVNGSILLIKRIVDIIVSIILLILTSPLFLISAILIKAQDNGSVIFKQERLTKNAKRFYLYKFRSMIMEAEADGIARLSNKKDARITPIGKFLRRTRFDELPQLINVLKGDITLVGPRPERPEIADQYEKTFPQFRYRLRVKAGLTGYSQVNGKYNTTPNDKLLMDLYYIENISLMMDFKILLMTAKVLILPDSTQGVDNVTAIDE